MRQHKWEEDGSICTVIEEDSGAIRFFGKAFHGSMPSGDESLLARGVLKLAEKVRELEAHEQRDDLTEDRLADYRAELADLEEDKRRLEGQVAELVRQLNDGRLDVEKAPVREISVADKEHLAQIRRAMMYR